MRSLRKSAALAAALVPFAFASAPALANPTPQQALTELNSWRAQVGESPATAINDPWNSACHAHNAYEQVNDVLTHFEDSSQAGYSSNGAAAGPNSVLSGMKSSSPPADALLLPGPTWDGAVFHRAALLQPRLATIGYDSTTYPSADGVYTTWTCLWDQNGFPGLTPPLAYDASRRTPAPTFYPSPANGATQVPTTFTDSENPDPRQETGVPANATLGWLLSVGMNGPWADTGGGGMVWAHDVTATLRPDGSGQTVPVVVSQCGTAGCARPGGTSEGQSFAGGFGIFPLQPLAANTTYHVTANGTVSENDGSGRADYPPFTLSWCFSTGATYTSSSDCTGAGAGPEPATPATASVPAGGGGTPPTVTGGGTPTSPRPGGGAPSGHFTIRGAHWTFRGGHLGLGLSLAVAGGTVRQVMLQLPAGVGVTPRAAALRRGVVASAPHHAKVSVGRSAGGLVASGTLSGLSLKVSGGALTVSRTLARRLRSRSVRSLPLTIVVVGADGGRGRLSMRLPVA